MRSSYLEKICDLNLKHAFLGVRPRDMLPKYKISQSKKPFSIIINLDKHYEPGSHFVLIYCQNNIIYYFDSFGIPPIYEEILTFINKQKCEYAFNKIQIQDENSLFCGYFCFGYLLAKDKKFTNDEFLNLFSTQNLSINDALIEHFIISSLSTK